MDRVIPCRSEQTEQSSLIAILSSYFLLGRLFSWLVSITDPVFSLNSPAKSI